MGTWSKGDTPSPSMGEGQGEGETCPVCHGAGFVHPLLDSGKPDFSRVLPCQCTREKLRKEKSGYLEKYSNLGPLSRFTLDNLSLQRRTKNFARPLQIAKEFADNPKGWLLFLGPSGCGKTQLACAIANHCLSLAEPVFYIGVADLLDHLRAAFSPSSDVSYDELFEQVKNTPLLVLDDLATQSTTPWAKEKLEQLLSHRFNAALPTVITTDGPLQKLDDRLRAYFVDNEFCKVCNIGEKPPLQYQDSLQLKLLRSMTFDNFDQRRLDLPLEQRENLQQAYQLAVDFAHSPDGWLIFQGVNGCGKTHLAAAIANYCRAQGKPVFFVIVPDLLDYLRSTFSPHSSVSYDEFFERLKESPLLILDDFGEQAATSWAQEKLYQLINYRYNARFPMVVTMCLSLDEIETRISSRMVDPRVSMVFAVTASDYRGNVNSTRHGRRFAEDF